MEEIKSPYFSQEDLERYSEILNTGIINNYMSNPDGLDGSEFISDDGKKYTIEEATIEEIERNTDVLYRKISKKKRD
jgi:hypothetical protein